MEPLTTEELKRNPIGIRNLFSRPKLKTQEASRTGVGSFESWCWKHGACVGAASRVVGSELQDPRATGVLVWGGELGLPPDGGSDGSRGGNVETTDLLNCVPSPFSSSCCCFCWTRCPCAVRVQRRDEAVDPASAAHPPPSHAARSPCVVGGSAGWGSSVSQIALLVRVNTPGAPE